MHHRNVGRNRDSRLLSFSEASRTLGIHRTVIAALVDWYGITPKPISANNRAKGLSRADISEILTKLGPRAAESPPSSPRSLSRSA